MLTLLFDKNSDSKAYSVIFSMDTMSMYFLRRSKRVNIKPFNTKFFASEKPSE